MSIHEWTDKQNVVCTHSRILFRFKKDWNSDTCNNMSGSWNIKQINQTQKNEYGMVPLI